MILLVIPAYNEGLRLPSYLRQLCPALASSGIKCTILVVDDGSGDAEFAKVKASIEELQKSFPFLRSPMRLAKNTGKGGAIYAGWNLATGEDWIAFVDADGAIPAYEVVRLFQLLSGADNELPDAIIASRVCMLGRTVERKFHRHLTGRIFATLASVLTGILVYDSQCGFKMVRRTSYEKIAATLTEKRFSFDMELIARLLRAGCSIREEPIDWVDQAGSKVSLLRDSTAMFVSLTRLARIMRSWPEDSARFSA